MDMLPRRGGSLSFGYYKQCSEHLHEQHVKSSCRQKLHFFSVGGSTVLFVPTQAELTCIIVKQVLMMKQMLT